MSERNIDVVISAKDEFTASLLRGTDGPGAHLLKLIESFKAVSSAATEAAEVLARMDGQLKGVGAESAAAAAFLNEKELMERRYAVMGIALQNEEQFNVISARSVAARAEITTAAYTSMQEQLLSLVETNRLATEEFGRIIVQQVKMELVGVAARAAVQALYFSALGFAALTPWGAVTLGPPMLFFKAAGEMAAISGAAYGGAQFVHSVVMGEGQKQYTPPGPPQAAWHRARP